MARTRKGAANSMKDAPPVLPPHTTTPTPTAVFPAADGAVDTSTTPASSELPQSQSTPRHGALASGNIAYAASAALLAARAIGASEVPASSHSEAEIHPDLRSALSPSDQTQPQPQSQYPPLAPAIMASAAPPIAPAVPAAPPVPVAPAVPVAAPTTPQAAIVDPSPQVISPTPADEDDHEVITDGRRVQKRNLSTTKRAAQNRAAQRAFRLRKESYIKKLEKQVLDSAEMENAYKLTQTENYALREYIIHLQSRLLDAKAELPQPPANLNLASPGMPPIIGLGPSPAVMAQQRHEQELQHQEQQRQLQHQRSLEQQKANTPLAAQGASVLVSTGSSPALTESPAAAPAKNDSSLARVAQAAAQLGSSDRAANGVNAGMNGIDDSHDKLKAEPVGNGDPMDTTEDSLNQSLRRMQQPVASM